MSLRKVVVITGGTSGIGFASARSFAREGYHVVVTGRKQEKLDEAEKQLKQDSTGGEILALQSDVSKADEVKELFEKVKEKFTRLDVLVANAGSNGVWAPIEDMEVEEFDQTIQTNLRGTWLAIKFGFPLMRNNGIAGSIIIVASINGTRTFANTGATAYSTSKAGQSAMGKMLALEFAKFRIRVNVVCPGAITTEIGTERRNLENIRLKAEFPEGVVPLTPQHEAGSADSVASVIHFLAGDDSRHVTGTEIFVDGGESLIAV
jgi:NAD(P)-dependent dehydrogenase (short-subunit alcohol dehydrogenase family)